MVTVTVTVAVALAHVEGGPGLAVTVHPESPVPLSCHPSVCVIGKVYVGGCFIPTTTSKLKLPLEEPKYSHWTDSDQANS
jgi:hypothetical protein